jgi:hypothetical protein
LGAGVFAIEGLGHDKRAAGVLIGFAARLLACGNRSVALGLWATLHVLLSATGGRSAPLTASLAACQRRFKSKASRRPRGSYLRALAAAWWGPRAFVCRYSAG